MVINTCGFIDARSKESSTPSARPSPRTARSSSPAASAPRTTWSWRPARRCSRSPARTPPSRSCTGASHLPKPHDPFIDLLPPQGVKLTPNHYAYLKISERLQPPLHLLHHPVLRGDLVSRPIGDVMREAENLVNAGVKELLVVSQDTSAYGVDVKYRTGFWGGKPMRTKLYDLCNALGDLGVGCACTTSIRTPASTTSSR